MNKRIQYITENFSLTKTTDGWKAEWKGFKTIEHADRAEVIRQARCRWGHMNHSDEARAFTAIFPMAA